MCSLRTPGPSPSLTVTALTLVATLTAALSLTAHAQTAETHSTLPTSSASPASPAPSAAADGINAAYKSPSAAGPATTVQPTTDQPSTGNILGTVLDVNGAEVPNATVALENIGSGSTRTSITNNDGFFKFDAVEQGRFSLTVTSTGFAPWTSSEIAIQTGQSYDLPAVALQIASATTDVEVTVSQHDIAEDQMHYAERQRVLGVFPNFYVSYLPHAVPLSSSQKFRLALITSADPVTIAIPGVIAAVEQSQDSYNGYGQGVAGFSRRFGAASADSAISMMITDAVLPSLLHQDPRYFYKGTGSVRSRALYAVAPPSSARATTAAGSQITPSY